MKLRQSVDAVMVIARQELRIALRNRWVVVYALIFTLLAAGISYFGLSIIEITGFQGFTRTTASLLNLVLYIVPLVAMLMTVQSFSAEGGATDQLFTEPVTRGEIVAGKLLGVSTAMALATLLGFGVPAIMIGYHTGLEGMGSYLILVGYCLATGAAFCSIAGVLVVLARRSFKAYAVVLVAWFFYVLLYDLLVIGVSFILPEGYANRVAYWSLFLNPVDSARIATLMCVSGKEMFGEAGALLVRWIGGVPNAIAALTAAMALWIVLPASWAGRLLSRQDI